MSPQTDCHPQRVGGRTRLGGREELDVGLAEGAADQEVDREAPLPLLEGGAGRPPPLRLLEGEAVR